MHVPHLWLHDSVHRSPQSLELFHCRVELLHCAPDVFTLPIPRHWHCQRLVHLRNAEAMIRCLTDNRPQLPVSPKALPPVRRFRPSTSTRRPPCSRRAFTQRMAVLIPRSVSIHQSCASCTATSVSPCHARPQLCTYRPATIIRKPTPTTAVANPTYLGAWTTRPSILRVDTVRTRPPPIPLRAP